MSILELQNVSYIRDNKTILQNISTEINKGDFVSIVGPSGSGKSTFLKLCSSLTSPSSGNILFNNKNYMDYSPIELRKNISYCFQSPYLFGDTVMENIEFPYKARHMKIDQSKIDFLFSIFNMSKDYLKRDVQNLSGGERQRIALIRSMLFNPQILLLDEVTSALDTENTAIVENAISSINKQGTTILWITHNPEQSKKYANKILTFNLGKIVSFEEL